MTTHARALCFYVAAIVTLMLGAYLRSFVFRTAGAGTVVLFATYLGAAAFVAKGRQVSRSG